LNVDVSQTCAESPLGQKAQSGQFAGHPRQFRMASLRPYLGDRAAL